MTQDEYFATIKNLKENLDKASKFLSFKFLVGEDRDYTETEIETDSKYYIISVSRFDEKDEITSIDFLSTKVNDVISEILVSNSFKIKKDLTLESLNEFKTLVKSNCAEYVEMPARLNEINDILIDVLVKKFLKP